MEKPRIPTARKENLANTINRRSRGNTLGSAPAWCGMPIFVNPFSDKIVFVQDDEKKRAVLQALYFRNNRDNCFSPFNDAGVKTPFDKKTLNS